jgi:hypothetical protein
MSSHSNDLLALFEATAETHPTNAPRYQSAGAKFDAVVRESGSSDASLDKLLDQYEDRLKDDDYLFSNFIRIALLKSRFDLASDLLNWRFQTNVWFRVALDDSAYTNVQVLSLRIDGTSSALFSISEHLRLSSKLDGVVLRWIQALPIFVEMYRTGLVESGDVKINLGDHGEIPGLAFCANTPDCFMIPDPHFIAARGYDPLRRHFAQNHISWSARTPIAFWRGSTTGRTLSDDLTGWRTLPRVRLCEIGREHPDVIDAGLSRITQMITTESEVEIGASGLVSDFVPATQFDKFKYQIDIDGNSNSWTGLFEKLLTASPVLKVTSSQGYRQWYYDRLKPWVNFVPVAADMSDLVEKIGWLRKHDDIARALGMRGYQLALSMDYEPELVQAARTVGAALRHFGGRPEVDLRFGRDEPGNSSLQEGWCPVLGAEAVASGTQSLIKLARPIAEDDFVLSLDLSPATNISPAHAPQRIIVVANGEVLQESNVAERNKLHCILSRRTIMMEDVLAVTLLHPDARIAHSAVHQCGGEMLSIVLHQISLTALQIHAGHHVQLASERVYSDRSLGHQDDMLPFARLQQLFTHLGTLVFLDVNSGALCHGPMLSSPQNVFLTRYHGGWHLVHSSGAVWFSEISVVPGPAGTPAQLRKSPSGSPQVWSIVPATGGGICLESSRIYLCAELEGAITLSRARAGPWERFLLRELETTTRSVARDQDFTASGQTAVCTGGMQSCHRYRLPGKDLIVDAFMFFNELDTLEVRLRELDSVVDLFVLLECGESHSGAKKPYIFDENRDRFAPFLGKIKHIRLPGLPPLTQDTERQRFWLENYQRNFLLTGLIACGVRTSDMIMISDVDEIPSRESVVAAANAVEGDEVWIFKQTYFKCFFDSKLTDDLYSRRWLGTVAARFSVFGNLLPNDLRIHKANAGRFYDPARQDGPDRHFIENGGWHMTYFGGANASEYKIANFTHGDGNPPVPVAVISRQGLSGLKVFDESLALQIRNVVLNRLSGDLPSPILENLQDYYHLFREAFL